MFKSTCSIPKRFDSWPHVVVNASKASSRTPVLFMLFHAFSQLPALEDQAPAALAGLQKHFWPSRLQLRQGKKAPNSLVRTDVLFVHKK